MFSLPRRFDETHHAPAVFTTYTRPADRLRSLGLSAVSHWSLPADVQNHRAARDARRAACASTSKVRASVRLHQRVPSQVHTAHRIAPPISTLIRGVRAYPEFCMQYDSPWQWLSVRISQPRDVQGPTIPEGVLVGEPGLTAPQNAVCMRPPHGGLRVYCDSFIVCIAG